MRRQHGVVNSIYLIILVADSVASFSWNSLNLPKEHIPFFFTNNNDIRKECENDKNCPFKDSLFVKKCWGYEQKCLEEHRLSLPSCPESSRGWAATKEAQIEAFWKAADFGYMKERRDELKVLCKPESEVVVFWRILF